MWKIYKNIQLLKIFLFNNLWKNLIRVVVHKLAKKIITIIIMMMVKNYQF